MNCSFDTLTDEQVRQIRRVIAGQPELTLADCFDIEQLDAELDRRLKYVLLALDEVTAAEVRMAGLPAGTA